MPESSKVLRSRIRSVNSTRKITRAMEMVAAAKLRRAQAAMGAARPYALKLQELLAQLAGSASVESHPLFQEREGNTNILVLFTSERGLCGSFNSNIIRLAEDHMRRHPDADWQLYCVGKKGLEYFQKRGHSIVESKLGLSGTPDDDLAREIANDLLGRFESGQVSSVHLAYPAFVTLAINRPTVAQFLHLDRDALLGRSNGDSAEDGGAQSIDYILEPSPERVFDALLPRYLTSKIYITMAEVFTSEHSARMIAMHNATKSCEDLSDELTLRMNKARQTQITNELIEIISGAQAV